jgi:hypothetical protein
LATFTEGIGGGTLKAEKYDVKTLAGGNATDVVYLVGGCLVLVERRNGGGDGVDKVSSVDVGASMLCSRVVLSLLTVGTVLVASGVLGTYEEVDVGRSKA